MNNDRREEMIAQRLAELRGSMGDFEAPASIRPVVLEAFRASRRRGPAVFYRWGAIAACAALLAAGLYWAWGRTARAPVARVPVVNAPAVVRNFVPPAPEHVVARATRPLRRRVSPSRSPVPQELATSFFALPYAAPLSPEDGGQVVRVTLPRSAMSSVGLPVNEDRWYDRVPADVVLGQDGIARAVRFVKVAQ